MSADVVLETRGLTKAFGGVRVTNDIDFILRAGERRALIGPNGAGKTTFINLVAGRLKPNGGTILLGGRDVTSTPESERVKLGIGRTFQINSLFRDLTVFENIFLSASERGGSAWSMLRPARRSEEIIGQVEKLLSRMGLSGCSEIPVRELAYGQQRLTEIAVALASQPEVLLLDEPAAGVPSGETAIILDAINALSKDIAVLLIDHDMDLVFRFADRITVLCQGSVLVEGTPREIADNSQVRDVYLGTRERAHA